ncbi:MAG: Uma2 family endonuclease, partial [Actinomycetota bacterium]|nr:Uma2 family endonuclease [Actinomycetota bacterium]
MFLTEGGYVLPDLQVAKEFPRGEHPRTASLIVEVANTSQRRDREKIADYARAGVPEYWIVDVVDELVVVHRGPSGEAYATISEHRD